MNGHALIWCGDPTRWADLLLILLNFTLFSIIMVQHSKCKESALFNLFFGVSVYVEWLKMLHSFRGLRKVGKKVLPIMEAMQSAGPFMGVLSIYMFGTYNFYVALNRNGYWDSFWIVYRMVFLLDIDWIKMEGDPGPTEQLLADGTIETVVPPRNVYHYIVYFFAYTFAFVLGTSLMNIYIAVLSECYTCACHSAESLLLRARTTMVLDAHEVLTASLKIRARALSIKESENGRAKKRVPLRISESEVPASTPLNYLWYFAPKEQVE